MVGFIGVPFVAGTWQKQAHPPIRLIAILLVLLCPNVYMITDQLAAKFEKLRDGFFLGAGSTIIFVSGVWLSSCLRSRRYGRAAVAAFVVQSAILAVLLLLFMVFYFE